MTEYNFVKKKLDLEHRRKLQRLATLSKKDREFTGKVARDKIDWKRNELVRDIDKELMGEA